MAELIEWKYIDTDRLYGSLPGANFANTTRIVTQDGVSYIEFTPFDYFDWVKLRFSTRLGGVSNGVYSSMNFAYDRGDSPENVRKNFDIFLGGMGLTEDMCVCTKQTHTTNVSVADRRYAGMGINGKNGYTDVDGLVTDEKNLCLVTYFADCVPVYFIDEENRCIGASHSGWRGTVGNITHETVELMRKTYGTRPQKLHTFIGPSICMNCYEVDVNVAEQFRHAYSKSEADVIIKPKPNGKYLLNLQAANYFNMINEGIEPHNIGISDLCTSCNSKLLFSHRASHGQRGVMCGFMYICG